MHKVASGEVQREFGKIRMEAHKDVVIITNHGRDDLALLSVDEYKRLRSLDQQALFAEELPEHIIKGLGTQEIAEEAQQFNDEYPS